MRLEALASVGGTFCSPDAGKGRGGAPPSRRWKAIGPGKAIGPEREGDALVQLRMETERPLSMIRVDRAIGTPLERTLMIGVLEFVQHRNGLALPRPCGPS